MTRRFVFLGCAALVLLALAPAPAGAGGFCLQEEKLSDRRDATVDMKDYCFFPQVVRIDEGDVVTWTNYDVDAHTVTAPGGWSGGHAEYLKGDDVSFRFNREGVFPYVCLLHPGMVGTVVVGDGVGKASAAPAASAVGYDEPKDTPSSPGEEAPAESSILPLLALVVAVVGGGVTLYGLTAWLRRRRAAVEAG